MSAFQFMIGCFHGGIFVFPAGWLTRTTTLVYDVHGQVELMMENTTQMPALSDRYLILGAAACQCLYMRRVEVIRAITPQTVDAKVIRQYEKDIG